MILWNSFQCDTISNDLDRSCCQNIYFILTIKNLWIYKSLLKMLLILVRIHFALRLDDVRSKNQGKVS